MSIAFGSNYTMRDYSWTAWKVIQSSKSLIYQYDDDGARYLVYGYDGPEIHMCSIYKSTVPYTVIQAGYSQSQNDTDKSDFETNYLSNVNRVIQGRTSGRMHVATDLSAGFPIVPASDIVYKIVDLTNTGGSTSMTVNGSTTPVNFDFAPAGSDVWYIEALHFFLKDNGTTLPTNFGSITALTNGVDVLIKTKGTEYTVGNMKTNMDVNLLFKDIPQIPGTSGLFESSDIFIGAIAFQNPIVLKAANSDYIRIKVRDNLTAIDQMRAKVKVWRTT